MKIDLTKTFTTIEGKTMKESGENSPELTLGFVATQAILNVLPGDDNLTGVEKNELFTLWFDNIKDKQKAELTAEQVSKIKERIGKAYPALIVGQAYKLLD